MKSRIVLEMMVLALSLWEEVFVGLLLAMYKMPYSPSPQASSLQAAAACRRSAATLDRRDCTSTTSQDAPHHGSAKRDSCRHIQGSPDGGHDAPKGDDVPPCDLCLDFYDKAHQSEAASIWMIDPDHCGKDLLASKELKTGTRNTKAAARSISLPNGPDGYRQGISYSGWLPGAQNAGVEGSDVGGYACHVRGSVVRRQRATVVCRGARVRATLFSCGETRTHGLENVCGDEM
jgi:hypothetical protein